MTVTIRYFYKSNNRDELKKVNELFDSLGDYSEVQDDNVFVEKSIFKPAGESFGVIFKTVLDDCKLVCDLLKKDIDFPGSLEESVAGEGMDFLLLYRDGQISAKTSDWYIEEWMGGYDDFESFQEIYPNCTEKEFNKWKEYEHIYYWYEENGKPVFSADVPLHDATLI